MVCFFQVGVLVVVSAVWVPLVLFGGVWGWVWGCVAGAVAHSGALLGLVWGDVLAQPIWARMAAMWRWAVWAGSWVRWSQTVSLVGRR